MSAMKIDLAVLTETKLSTSHYTKHCFGYNVIATESEEHSGGVAIVYKKSKHWALESVQCFGPNVIRATIVCGQKRWSLIGAYVSPSERYSDTLDFIMKANSVANNFNWPTILLGDFNIDIEKYLSGDIRERSCQRKIDTATLIETLGLVSIRSRFRQRRGKLNKYWTFCKRMNGEIIGSICDHILTDAAEDFINCQIKEPRMDCDHFILKSILGLPSLKHHRRYLKRREAYPIRDILASRRTEADNLLADLKKHQPLKGKTDGREESWISAEAWTLIDRKAVARRTGDTTLASNLGRQLWRTLRRDRRVRCEKVAETIAVELEKGKIRDAFNALKGWYRAAGPLPPLPSREEIGLTRAEYKNLYQVQIPSSPPIPIHANPFAIDDSPPHEFEVIEALLKMKNGKAAGASGITVETMKKWHREARPLEGEPLGESVILWEKVLKIIRMAFAEGKIPKAFCNGILVLIPKGKPGEFRGIALLETLYKLISSIINNRLQSTIVFDDAIHGFRRGRGCNTAIMEAKLLMQYHYRKDSPLYMVFIDLKKAYDTLDREQALRILKGYGVGPAICNIISLIWAGDRMVPRQAGYYGRAFRASRGVRQGDIMSPVIFNIMVDAVIRHWRFVHRNEMGETPIFYADDGLIAGTDPALIQKYLDTMILGFDSLGLKMNAIKTEYMVATGTSMANRLSTVAYNRKITKIGKSHRERQSEKIICSLCGSTCNRANMKNHQKTRKCALMAVTYSPSTQEQQRVEEEAEVEEAVLAPATYDQVSIPLGCDEDTPCPVPNCVFKVNRNVKRKRMTMRTHFMNRHPSDTIAIVEEGLLPRCSGCGWFGRTATNESHRSSLGCYTNSEKRRRYFKNLEKKKAKEVVFRCGDSEINRVTEFKYLGRMLEEHDNDECAVNRQIDRAKKTWGRVGKVLSARGVHCRTMGYFYKAIVQAVLLYGSETWTITDAVMKKLRSFHARVARYICKRHIRPLPDGTWHLPPTSEVLEECGLFTIDEYICKRRSTVMNFVRDRDVFERCRDTGPVFGNPNQVVWWKLPIEYQRG
jgi:hypothetical protein